MIDKLFHIVDDMQVILRRRNGVSVQAKVYRRDTERGVKLYAAVSGGFVELMARGGTSVASTAWEDLHNPRDFEIGVGRFGGPVLLDVKLINA